MFSAAVKSLSFSILLNLLNASHVFPYSSEAGTSATSLTIFHSPTAQLHSPEHSNCAVVQEPFLLAQSRSN